MDQAGQAVLLDFEKAFDSVEWPAINAALEYHGFGPIFISWINCLQTSPQSTILNAGHFCSFFDISRGVRQGCPLSPYIFILTIEVLADAIRSCPNIKGIELFNHVTKINLYADDVTLLLKDDPQNRQNCLDLIAKFSKISGLKLNNNKTEYLGLGNNRLANCDPVTLLGVRVVNEDMFKENLCPIYEKVEGTLRVWRQRNISMFGRIYIVRSLCISKMLHVLAVLPTLPDHYLKMFNTLFYDFIWKKGNEKIKRDVLIGPWDLGGAMMPDLISLVKTVHLRWITRLWNDSTSPWKVWLEYNSILPDIQHLFECNLPSSL
jgi:hypothetical protein